MYPERVGAYAPVGNRSQYDPNDRRLAGAGIGAGLGGALGNTVFNLFGAGRRNPANDARPYLEQGSQLYAQAPGAVAPYLNPYMQAGASQLQPLSERFASIMNNPGATLNQLGSGYHESPGYRFNVEEQTKAANQAAAAGGMLGSPAHQQELARAISGYANQDYNNYLGHASNLFGAGLQGSQGLAGLGQNAATNYADIIRQSLSNQAQQESNKANLAYEGGINDLQKKGGAYGSLGTGLGALAGLFLGGPAGAGIGGGLGSFIGDLFG